MYLSLGILWVLMPLSASIRSKLAILMSDSSQRLTCGWKGLSTDLVSTMCMLSTCPKCQESHTESIHDLPCRLSGQHQLVVVHRLRPQHPNKNVGFCLKRKSLIVKLLHHLCCHATYVTLSPYCTTFTPPPRPCASTRRSSPKWLSTPSVQSNSVRE